MQHSAMLHHERLRLEREQATAFVELLLDGMPAIQIASKMERFELICAQRGWRNPDLLLPSPSCQLASEQ
jgi:hypothetical protein